MRFIKLLLLIFISAAFAAFAIVNRETVLISAFPLPYDIEVPKFLLALVCTTLGAAVAGLVMLASYLHHARELRAAKRRIMALENEIGGMKAEQRTSLPAVRK